ncbi:tetratricopeptide repeat protein [Frankia sp. CNm7]|uniref:Tetratricopeptide repeat protein n=1 Tax=Frankia nepalensis TaxID=1836974 RepID=A0A937RIK0_9ACTN|nr:tetratricopeptide repeat protein [Frankia nepalensis]MBL7501447.1 tetratricopeptide repeat protein [Frankia nepalensis]MBL7509990.1 tetratricopeptide repeat protein [Frankia nepalensis]MBL7517160.1 tetratricopeptide repeat protein [Frankia nepalensis]MBL7627999.1 tetratricopeptide repeat protein [Frankia nepalensis]
MTSPHPSGEATGLDRAGAVEAIQNLLDVRRFADARTRAVALLGEQPDDPQALGLLAQALLGLGEHASALQAAQQVIAASPEDEWGYRLASLAHEGLGQFWYARDAAQRATALAPHFWPAWIQLADTARALSPYGPEAHQAAAEALRLAPHEAAVQVTYGVTLMHRDIGAARSAFEEALRLDPGNAAARNNLAVLDLRANKFRQAGEGLIRAAAADPRDTVAQDNLRAAVHTAVGWACVAVFVFIALLAKPLLLQHHVTGQLPILYAIIWIVTETLALGVLAWWLLQLSPRLRRHLWYLVTRDATLSVLVLSVVAVGVLGTVGLTTAGTLGLTTRILTLVVAIAARILTEISARRLQREHTD